MKDPDLKKVLIIGSGPIVIGQAAEFDYAGTQACKAVREEGITTVLINSNPATIMTDEDVADVVYIEPLTVDVVERIIQRERPDGLLATLGGQTGLNLAREVQEAGILERYGVRLLGTPISAIRQAEDRDLFRRLMLRIEEPIPGSDIAHTVEEARVTAAKLGFPVIVRPAYTLGGTGGGIADHPDQLDDLVRQGVDASPIGQVLVEEYLAGWKEIEYEVMRDAAGTCVTICNMENFDPMGVHTGDSIVFAPSQTLSDKEYQLLRSASLKIIDALDIAGGCNVQLALDLNSFQYRVIEVNPRVSRSSALASKATGYPIARIAAKIAIGFRLDELANPITGETAAAFEPALDYVVAKIPRWPFDKFPGADRSLGTQMKATGEVMSIERTIEGAINKALRSLEISGRSMLWEDPAWADRKSLERAIRHPNDQRIWAILAALRRGHSVEAICALSAIDQFFIAKLSNLVAMELRLLGEPLDGALLWDAKRLGFPDSVIGQLADYLPDRVRQLRKRLGIIPVYKLVDTCAAEFAAVTPYFYSTYESENEADRQPGQAAVVVGSGPIRIGQGIEFDYCSVHSAWALQESGWRAVMINSNPETVSTDFDTSDRLYFEALDVECVADVIENEAGSGDPRVVVQFGGQTAINLAEPLYNMGVALTGSDAASIDASEDREKLDALLEELGIPRPPGATVRRIEDALAVAERIGYPVLIRPSYVLGGRAMEIASDAEGLSRYIANVTQPSPEHPVLIDKYLQGLEVEVDAVCDGEGVLIPGIMEHIERAGVHSGDSFAVYPTQHVAERLKRTLVDYTERIAKAVRAVGLLNIQYVIWQDQIYVIEVNPRASRTVPFLSKVTGIPMVALATKAMLGQSLPEQGWDYGHAPERPLVAVKAPVFSHAKLTGVDTFLGPEMKSTGEAMGVEFEFAPALRKAMLAAGLGIPEQGTVIMSIADRDKAEALPVAVALHERGYQIKATRGTASFLGEAGIPAHAINRLNETSPGEPSLLDHVRGPDTVLVINTLTWDRPTLEDGFRMRRSANERMIPCLTSLDTAKALVRALDSVADEFVLPIDRYRHDRRQ